MRRRGHGAMGEQQRISLQRRSRHRDMTNGIATKAPPEGIASLTQKLPPAATSAVHYEGENVVVAKLLRDRSLPNFSAA
ncbi:hypothetical protein HN51_021530 [Arachis hypogaea]